MCLVLEQEASVNLASDAVVHVVPQLLQIRRRWILGLKPLLKTQNIDPDYV